MTIREDEPFPPGRPASISNNAHVDSTLVKAIARALRWQKMLEAGRYATIREIARAERINTSYVSRVLRLTLLAPATVEAILDGRVSPGPTLAEAMVPFPLCGFSNAQNRMHSLRQLKKAILRNLAGSSGAGRPRAAHKIDLLGRPLQQDALERALAGGTCTPEERTLADRAFNELKRDGYPPKCMVRSVPARHLNRFSKDSLRKCIRPLASGLLLQPTA